VADLGPRPNHDPSFEHDMVTDDSLRPDGHLAVDHREGADVDPRTDLRPRIHNGCGVDGYFLPPLPCKSWS
jgi:hypothetical protein